MGEDSLTQYRVNFPRKNVKQSPFPSKPRPFCLSHDLDRSRSMIAHPLAGTEVELGGTAQL